MRRLVRGAPRSGRPSNVYLRRGWHLQGGTVRTRRRGGRPVPGAVWGSVARSRTECGRRSRARRSDPAIPYVVMEGSYAVEGAVLTAYTTRFLLVADGRHGPPSTRPARRGDGRRRVGWGAESGPLITELVAEGTCEEPLIASGFSVQDQRLTFREGEFAGAVFVRDGTESTASTRSFS